MEHLLPPSPIKKPSFLTPCSQSPERIGVSSSSHSMAMKASSFFFHGVGEEEERGEANFLASCSLCRSSLVGKRDIYMYRGDTPFCSEECREERIESDEAEERCRRRRRRGRGSATVKADASAGASLTVVTG